jgi:tRNA nucleotidyltransferase (CCA-adding enzyme)
MDALQAALAIDSSAIAQAAMQADAQGPAVGQALAKAREVAIAQWDAATDSALEEARPAP